jgi:hypothetical protein
MVKVCRTLYENDIMTRTWLQTRSAPGDWASLPGVQRGYAPNALETKTRCTRMWGTPPSPPAPTPTSSTSGELAHYALNRREEWKYQHGLMSNYQKICLFSDQGEKGRIWNTKKYSPRILMTWQKKLLPSPHLIKELF